MFTLEELIIGSLLGDGCIPKLYKYSKNNYLQIGHGPKQKEYCKYKYDLFTEFGVTNKFLYSITKNERYRNGFIEDYRFKTKALPIFNEYRNLFYPEGKKIIPTQILEKINEKILAIWYMDDGALAGRLRAGKHICTNGFTSEDVHKLKEVLESK